MWDIIYVEYYIYNIRLMYIRHIYIYICVCVCVCVGFPDVSVKKLSAMQKTQV